MKGVVGVCCALAAVQGAMGFVAPISTSALAGSVRLSSVTSAVRTQSCASRTRLSMSTTELPKFSVSLMDDTRVTFQLEKENLQKLAAEVNNILGSFKRLKTNAADGGKPYREETVEYKDTIGDLNILVECNPNIFPDPFKAQVFIRIWDKNVEINSQAMLTKLTDAIKQHMAAIKAQG